MFVPPTIFGTVLIVVCIVGIVLGLAAVVRFRRPYSDVGQTGSLWLYKSKRELAGERNDERRANTMER